VEGSWTLPSLKDERVGGFEQFLGFGGDHWSAEISQFYALTGRLGLPMGNWLTYVKGGFAGAHIQTALARPGLPNFIAQSKNWHDGWTIGGGAEYMFVQNWTIGLEYDYYEFERKEVSAVRTNDLAVNRWRVDPDNIHAVTARMNFKFN
jgi:outer membrane immunogenic protein